jgi:hypothetical protein
MRAFKENWNFIYINRVWRWFFEVKQVFIKKKIVKFDELKTFLEKRKIILNTKDKNTYDNLL